jgi:hypothetical protein
MVTRLQHYVPQFHLRRWRSGKPNFVRVLDKADHRIFRANPRNIGGERFFHSNLPEAQVIEQWFGDMERKAAAVYEKIDQRRDVAGLTHSERFNLCQYIAASLVRTREAREEVRQMSEGLLNAIAQRMGVTDWEVKLTEGGALGHHLNSFKDIPRYVPLLMRLDMILEVNKTNLPLTTSDHPVVRHNDLPPRPGGGGRLGIASPGIQLHMPISPELCLLLLDSTTYGKFPSRWILTDPENVIFERWLQLDQSFRHVFSRTPEDFRHELWILKENPDISDLNRKRFTTS